MQVHTIQQRCLSHTLQQSKSPPVDQLVKDLCSRIEREGDHPQATVQQQMDMVQQLAQFALGRYLLLHRGLNAYWSRYIKVLYSQKYRALGVNPDGEPFTPMERWYLEQPLAQATRECWQLCRELLQQHVRSNVTLASVPCGALDDLLELDFTGHSNVSIVGVDLDPHALRLAEENAKATGLQDKVQLQEADAWNLGVHNQWDVLTSKGLSSYVPNLKQLEELFAQFYLALKPGGTLAIILPLPQSDRSNPKVPFTPQQHQDFQLSEVLKHHVLKVRWNPLLNRATAQDMLQKLGFRNLQFFPSSNGLTAVATAQK